MRVGGHGEPRVLRDFLFKLPRAPTRIADGEHCALDFVVLVQAFDDVARGGERDAVGDAQTAVPVADGRVQHEAALGLHRAAHHHILVFKARGRVFADGGEHHVHGYGRGFVHDNAHCAVFAVFAQVNQAA